MRNIWKKTAAAFLALALCLSFAGCYDENLTWAAKKGDDTLPIGGYIYYLYSAYSEAAGKVGSDTEVLKSTVEEKDASAWIKDRAKEYLGAYYFINAKFDELGLELTEEDLTAAESNTSYAWPYYQQTLEALGVARESFHQAYTLYNSKFQKVLQAMYSEGGEKEIPKDDLKAYLTDNYCDYEYFYATYSKTGEDGNSVAFTDEEKVELKDELKGYVDKINAGTTDVNTAATDYAYAHVLDSTYTAPGATKKEQMGDDIADTVNSLENGKAALAETDSGCYVIKKLDVAEKFDSILADSSQLYTLLSDMKGEEFNDYVIEQGKSLEGVELNEKAINKKKLSSLVNDNNKNGTSSVASEDEKEESSSEPVSSEPASSETSK